MKTINTLLIANRGEIACRIIRTAKQLGIKTVAIYSTPDENALHCQLSDEAFCVGPAPSEKSYLNIERIIDIAVQNQCDAIHPGYGFLAENPQFAAGCEQAGVIFVGPSAKNIAQMAIKDEAKAIMQKAGVPTIPGGSVNDAQRIGFPLLVKPAKGGGGKGMHVVHNAQELKETIAAAKRESLSSFGDDTLFLEKYLSHPRHIEVQIFRDSFGNAVHLFERDCSLQRRHQKILEEAPAYQLPSEITAQLYQAALKAAHTIDYLGAGTVEFLVDQNQFYFMEMNTRLQVEHPVTEMITGIDLVAWQIRIAQGEALPLKQEDIIAKGHAVEVRIYAEDPSHHFLPMTGLIKKIITPPPTLPCRIDNGIQVNDQISIYYDPILAKVIAHGQTRHEALSTLQDALQHYHIVGVKTNLGFLRNILQSHYLHTQPINTQFLEEKLSELLPKDNELTHEALAVGCLTYLLQRQTQAISNSPWQQTNAWRNNLPWTETLHFLYQKQLYAVDTRHDPLNAARFHLRCEAVSLDQWFSGQNIEDKLHYLTAEKQSTAEVYYDDEHIEIFIEGKAFNFQQPNFMQHAPATLDNQQHIIAPMPGVITQLWVKTGDSVTAGTKLLALEAMKMEHTLNAPKSGKIKSIYHQHGEQVEEGTVLIDFEE